MSHDTNEEKYVRVKERQIKNLGRKLRDKLKEGEDYPKKIDRLDIVGIEDEDQLG